MDESPFSQAVSRIAIQENLHLLYGPAEKRRSDFCRVDASLNIVQINKTHDTRRGLPPLEGRLDFGAARKVDSTHQSMVDTGRVHT
jgi:hypothetical protein